MIIVSAFQCISLIKAFIQFSQFLCKNCIKKTTETDTANQVKNSVDCFLIILNNLNEASSIKPHKNKPEGNIQYKERLQILSRKCVNTLSTSIHCTVSLAPSYLESCFYLPLSPTQMLSPYRCCVSIYHWVLHVYHYQVKHAK